MAGDSLLAITYHRSTMRLLRLIRPIGSCIRSRARARANILSGALVESGQSDSGARVRTLDKQTPPPQHPPISALEQGSETAMHGGFPMVLLGVAAAKATKAKEASRVD